MIHLSIGHDEVSPAVSSAGRTVSVSTGDNQSYQRVISPDCLPLSNGRKPILRDGDDFDSKLLRPRSSPASAVTVAAFTIPNGSPFPHFPDHHPDGTSPSPAPKATRHDSSSSGNGNVLLQWGHNKRSRGSRAAPDDSSPGDHSRRPAVKIQRRASAAGGAAKLAVASAMPPPGGSYVRGANLRPCTLVRDATSPPINRTTEERSGGGKRSPPPELANHETTTTTGSGGEKLNLEQFEWPRIYLSLSRKEKEDDFLAMKGTKLSQRPKKRAKNVDKNLQYCYPGMWLSDLTRSRYEVREKKCAKKKRRGLKGMENIDSDSE